MNHLSWKAASAILDKGTVAAPKLFLSLVSLAGSAQTVRRISGFVFNSYRIASVKSALFAVLRKLSGRAS